MHPPFARGVTHLMYVGDTPTVSPLSSAAGPAFAISAVVAVFGKDLGVSKRTRKVAGAVALASLALRIGA